MKAAIYTHKQGPLAATLAFLLAVLAIALATMPAVAFAESETNPALRINTNNTLTSEANTLHDASNTPSGPASTLSSTGVVDPIGSKEELRGMWFSFVDFAEWNLYNASESSFAANFRAFCKEAKRYGVNAVFFHVRAFDDAAWKSDHFPACHYITSAANRNTSSRNTYTYDPLGVAVREAHACGIELHAWLNPYRVDYNYYLDPGDSNSTNRILLAVKEVLALGVDGIHFDDYFYHATSGYKRSGNYRAVAANLSSTTYSTPNAQTMRTNVNTMVKRVNATVHKTPGAVFGIGPAGNWENCMAAGADVETWLSQKGYLDYIAPQIYWTNQWGSSGNIAMFSDRLHQFMNANTARISFIVGLASVFAGTYRESDRGWSWRSDNLATQLKQIRKEGAQGWILYSATDLKRSSAATELSAFRKAVYSTKATGITCPTTVSRGCTHTVSGKIVSPYSTISRIHLGIVSAKTGSWVKGHTYRNTRVNARTFNLQKAASSLKFSTLPSGTYYFRVWARDAHGITMKVVNKKFTVKKTLSVKFIGANKPSIVRQGTTFNVRGTMQSNLPIKRIMVVITNANTGKHVYKYDSTKVNTRTFNLTRAASSLKFQKLAKGTYYYRVWIRTDHGSKRVLGQRFRVV